ncbi:hypothetical protein ACFXHA_25485 [Nocardia sp. NPDC059240]|uniref:hypothetical protein n=1 Tax=Nocardia sp. NPDC059240 TaxID=3346786 RepID=UPI0036B49C61
MFRTGIACTAAVLAALTLTACNDNSKHTETTVAAASATTQPAAVPSTVAQSAGGGDACTEVQYEIDLAHQLQQGQEPADGQAAILRLSKFRPTAPTAIIAQFAQVEALIVGHVDKKGPDQINSDAADVLLGKLAAWKSANC